MPDNIDTKRILKRAEHYKKPMISFLRDMVAIPGESGGERKVIARIREEMKKTEAFDRIWIDNHL